MAVTQNTYTGNGSTTLYTFTFPYLEEDEIKVSLNGTLTTAYTLANATTISFTTAPANGVAIRIYRDTDVDTLQSTFFAGSAIRAQDLNSNFLQSNYSVQEIKDRFLDRTGGTMSGNLAMGGYKVTGLGAPTASADAVTKSYVDGYINTTYLGPSATDPATRPGGSPLQVGDQYFNTNQNILKAWTGTVWVISAAAGSIIRWRKTASAGNTTLSGVDDLGITLSYVVGNEQVFLNGALQTRGVDYTAATGTSITFTPALLAGDVVELHAVQGYVSATVPDGSVGETKLAAGAVTSAKIADGTILDADVNASAGIVASKLSFTQTGAGAVQRQVEGKLKDTVSVKDFGAVGDGVADDTAAIQAALNTTAKVVQLGQGSTYLVTAALASSVSDRVIVGDGSTITTNGSILAANAVLTLSGARSKVLNLRFTGTAGTTLCSAIQLTSGDSCEISGCHISDFTNGAGIVATSSATKHVIVNNQLNNCNPISFGGLQYGSIHCNADKSLISGNRIANADLTGISTFAGKYLTIKSNYIEGKSGSATAGGILLDGYTVGCVIDSNTINGCKVEGIQIAGSVSGYGAQSRDHIISNNCILEAEYSGISLYGADTDAVVNINITGNQIKSLFTINRGIELNRCSGVNITGNYVYGYATGIQVPNAAPNVTVNSNVFEAQLTYGVLAHGRYWTVSGNRIIGRAGGTTTGIVFNGSAIAGDQLISSNFIRNCLKGIDGTFSTAQPTHVRGNRFNANATDFTYSGDSPNSSSGNAFNDILSGTFSLSGGIAAVYNSNIRANDKINIWFLNWGVGGSQLTVGQQQIIEISAGNRFVVESTKATDVSQLAYEIVR